MKSLTHLHFGTQVPRTGVPIAHIETDDVFSDIGMVVLDTSDTIPQNTFFEQDTVLEFEGEQLTHFISKRGFILTDQFNNNKALYWKHTLNEFIYIGENGTADIVIIDQDGNQIASTEYIFDCANNYVYHRLDPDDGSIYTVVYARVDSNNNIVNREHRELLSAESALVEAKSSDLDDCGELDPDSDGYILTEEDGEPHLWRLQVPRQGKYSLRFNEDGLLQVQIQRVSASEPWYVDIKNNTVLVKHLTQDVALKYQIAEFNLQNFQPFPPVKLSSDVDVSEISNGILDLKTKNIITTNKTPLDIIIKDARGRTVRALTSDANKMGRLVNNTYWEVDGIRSIDTANGRVSIRRRLLPGERATASFYYESNTYTYTGYNFNPLFNPNVLGKKVAIVVRPSFLQCNNTIAHVEIDGNDTVLSSSDATIQDWIDEGTRSYLQFQQQFLYIPGVALDNTNNYYQLALITAASPISPDFAEITDVRRRGGGVIDDLVQQALSTMPEAASNWDIGFWDGPPVPVHGSMLILLPSSIRNAFTEDEIRARVLKHAAAGSHPVIRYYD